MSEKQGGIFPDLDQTIGEFEAVIKWQDVNSTERVPEPVKGFDSEYDKSQDQLEKCMKELSEYLSETKKHFHSK